MSKESKERIIKLLTVVVSIYFFLLSIKLLGHSFKLFGAGFAENMLRMTSNPFAGLFIGVIATSLIQSSSTTTSLVVGMVAGGAITLNNAIPIIMGANIGTTITNTLVSMGHISKRAEFRRAFGAGIVHDLFNICAVLAIFPIELKFHILADASTRLESWFSGVGGLKLFNPLKAILNPAINFIDQLFSFVPYNSVLLLILSLVILFLSLTFLVKTIRSLVLEKLEIIINKYLFRNDLAGLVFGIIMTSIVQSSSVTTSLIIPLAGAGIISLRQIFPYTMGANIGTTITAILAALATQNHLAVTVAFAHLSFNILGILLFYPLKFIPIKGAEYISERASRSNKNMVIIISGYLLLYIIPIILIFMG